MEVGELIAGKPFLAYAALNWHEHIKLTDRSPSDIFACGNYTAILDISMPQFWGWFLVAADHFRLTKRRSDKSYGDIEWLISSVWVSELQSPSFKNFGHFLREMCILKMYPMDSRLSALLCEGPDSKTPAV